MLLKAIEKKSTKSILNPITGISTVKSTIMLLLLEEWANPAAN